MSFITSLQLCFSLLSHLNWVICLSTTLLRSHHSVLTSLRSGLYLAHYNTLIRFFFRHSVADLLLCLGSLSCWWPSFSQALAVRQMASHLTLKYFGIQRSSWSTARCPSPVAVILHHRVWQLVWSVCADMLCLILSKRAAVHYDQTSPVWSCLFKLLHYLFALCSDATLQT